MRPAKAVDTGKACAREKVPKKGSTKRGCSLTYLSAYNKDENPTELTTVITSASFSKRMDGSTFRERERRDDGRARLPTRRT